MALLTIDVETVKRQERRKERVLIFIVSLQYVRNSKLILNCNLI